MDQKKLRELLLKYTNGQCTPEEERMLDEWYASIRTDQKPFEDADQERLVKRRTWSVISEAIDQTRARPKKVIRFSPWFAGAVAASIIAVLMVVVPAIKPASTLPALDIQELIVSDEISSVVNNTARPLTVTLPDSSQVTLSPTSRIKYAQSFSTKNRPVYLEGEAFFDVARDEHRPFLVYTDGLTTQVLGTSFLVKAYKEQEEIVVTVKSGKVAVYKNLTSKTLADNKSEEVILTPNQQLVYKRDEMSAVKQLVTQPQPVISTVVVDNSYTNLAVVELLKSLEKTYEIPIHYDSLLLSECTLTSDLSEEGFYEQIEILCNALGAHYEISEDAVTITATGCMGVDN